LALKSSNVTPGGNNFNDIPDNQLTKFGLLIGWSRIFTPSPKFLWSMRFVAYRMDVPDRHNGQTYNRTCQLVS